MHINLGGIELDPAKDETNRAKHDVSLQEADGFDWATALEREDDRFDYGEVRFVAIGLIGASLYVMVFAQGSDDDSVRIMPARSGKA